MNTVRSPVTTWANLTLSSPSWNLYRSKSTSYLAWIWRTCSYKRPLPLPLPPERSSEGCVRLCSLLSWILWWPHLTQRHSREQNQVHALAEMALHLGEAKLNSLTCKQVMRTNGFFELMSFPKETFPGVEMSSVLGTSPGWIQMMPCSRVPWRMRTGSHRRAETLESGRRSSSPGPAPH